MKATFGEKLFYAANYFLLSLAGLSCMLPLIHLFAISLSDPGAIMSGRVTLWPVHWNVLSYEALITGTRIVEAFRNSVLITIVGVVLSMTASTLVAYPLSKPYFFGRRFFSMAIVFTMMFGGGLIPNYLLIKSLGLINSYWAIWLPGLISTYNMWVMKTFFQNIPVELENAARIDGCGEFGLLLRIILPTSLPMIATISLFYAVGNWNNFFGVLIYIHDTSKLNLAVLVQQMVFAASDPNLALQSDMQELITPEGVKAAGVLIMIIPMLIVYPFIQKHFVKGVMIGSLKG
ncbi:ABC transporter permease [Paenibacillus sp. Soil766]|uniref:carbohydrate ABC transporter permease n=1 Tax=Paenibacillus sp. Soil766 TaxID=1736404 RepID=UPI0007094F7C|nr:carbohydrate ABC transporter permease [Paenibacillus sp. Soil766]KRF10283.1 ABC transporter permease [Paenibacillus sp. Soil766]